MVQTTLVTNVILLSSPNAASCQKPGRVTHGVKIGNDFGHGKSVRYQCDDNYILEGNNRITCDDGKWNFDPPKCKGRYMSLLNVMGNSNAQITNYLFTCYKTSCY